MSHAAGSGRPHTGWHTRPLASRAYAASVTGRDRFVTERDTATDTAPDGTAPARADDSRNGAVLAGPAPTPDAAAGDGARPAGRDATAAPDTTGADTTGTGITGTGTAGTQTARTDRDDDRPRPAALPSRLRLWGEGVAMAATGWLLAYLYVPALRDPSQTIFQDVITNAMSPDHTGQASWLRGGFLPLWSRSTYGGEPYVANMQHAVLYPGNLPFQLFSPATALDLMIFTHLAIAAAGMWALLRLGLRTSMWAAVLGAVAYTVGSVTLGHIILGNQLQVICLTPWLFLCGHLALEVRKLRWVVMTAVMIGLTFLAGHPEEWLYAMASLAAYGGAWILLRERGGILRRLLQASLTLGGSVLLFVLLFSWQLLPTLLLKSQGYRSSPTFNQSYPLPKAIGVNALLPDFGKVLIGENEAFIGTAALCLVGLAVAARRRGLLWVKVWLLVTALAGFVMALGTQNEVAAFLNHHSALVRSFRVPSRYLVMTYLAMCVGAAIGLDELLHSAVGRWRQRISQAAVAAAVLAAGLGVLLLLADLRNDGLSWKKWGLAGLIGGLVWLAASFRRVPRPVLAGVLILLTATELFYARPYAEYRQKGPNILYEDYGATLTALGEDGGRYLTIATAPTAAQAAEITIPPEVASDISKRNYYFAGEVTRLMARPATNRAVHAATLLGRDGGLMPLRRYRDFYVNALGGGGNVNSGITATPPSRWNWTAVDFTANEWFVTGDNLPASERAVLEQHGFRVVAHESYVLRWQRPEPPLARLVHQVDVIPDYDQRAAALAGYPFGERAIVEQSVALDPAPAGGDSVQTVQVADNSVEVRTTSTARSLLVLADPYYPGWRVTVDGRPATVLPADHAFRGVVVPAGTHTVRFSYLDSRFWFGLVLAGLTTLGLLGVTFLAPVLRRRFRRRGVPADGVPVDGEPAGGVPADGEPAGGVPAGGEPAGGVPAGAAAAPATPATPGGPGRGTPGPDSRDPAAESPGEP
jgi:hypothetical protein